jgi:hypothetical protein
MLAMAAVTLVVGAVFVYNIDYQTPTIELRKDEWDCVMKKPAGACVEYRRHK